MRQKSLTDVCVISEDPFFINRIKIFSKNSKITFEYSDTPHFESSVSLFLVDGNNLNAFLNEKPFSYTFKFIVCGKQKDLALSFNAGCTDFLKEPWNNDELEARIFKIFNISTKQLQWDKLLVSQKTIFIDGFSTDISIEEYVILKKLIENRKEAVPREALLFALWGKHTKDSRVVDMHISNLRKKIKSFKKYNESCCGQIKTIRSYGYMII